MMRRVLGATSFLTVLPVRTAVASPGASAMFFPWIGALLGLAASGCYQALAQVFPASIASLLALIALVVLGGGLHEDALADVFDAFRGYRPPEKILAILKDSRIGAFGAIALLFSILLRWECWLALGPQSAVSLMVSASVGRAAPVALAWISPPAGAGLGRRFIEDLTSAQASGAIASALLIAMVPAWSVGAAACGVAACSVFIARAYFTRRIGGVTGDCLGATALCVECATLLVFVWARST